MMKIGLTGWGDHDDLYPERLPSHEKLKEYSKHFQTVEVDSSFYAIQPVRNYEKWVHETPDDFEFVVKAYQGMTGHQRGKIPFVSEKEMFSAFVQSVQPLVEANKLAMVLFQFPPWFVCTKDSVNVLRKVKRFVGHLPLALEFRHQSWFLPQYREQTLQFMKEEGWIHSICDEPQAGLGSVPTVLEVTNQVKTLIRLHGRNVDGWIDPGDGTWRDVRYLYDYSTEELSDWVRWIKELQKETNELHVLFNNNSGGDAAKNAKELQRLFGETPRTFAPRQISLFED